jgi:hypothetical protein
MGEAIAYLECLKFAIGNSTANLVIEIDLASIIVSFKETSGNHSEVCLLASEFGVLKPPGRQVNISKMMRSCSKVALSLCQLSRSVLCGDIIQGVVSTCASKAALEDCKNYIVS